MKITRVTPLVLGTAWRNLTFLKVETDEIIVFDYQGNRSGQHARNFLNGWQGYLMVDDYVGYKALFNEHTKGAPCIELACFAHARREALRSLSRQPHPNGQRNLRKDRGNLCA